MDFIEQLLETLKDWTRKIMDLVLGPEAEPELEPIPIPVEEPYRRR